MNRYLTTFMLATAMAATGAHAQTPPKRDTVKVTLDTGRTHQIRVHLQAIGHPVAGDPEYGHPGLLGLTRQFLHARHLAFTHPVTGTPITIESPLPEDLQQFLSALTP